MRTLLARLTFLSRLVVSASLLLGVLVCARGPMPTAEAAPPGVVSASPPANAPSSFAPLVESVKSAVVNVSVRTRAGSTGTPEAEFFQRFFGTPERYRAPPVRQGAGSGFIIDSQGLVLTNNHVVDGADDIRVKLDDGRSFKARVLGRDPLTDLALLRLEQASGLPAVRLGDSDAMRVGDWVVAIGNPFGLASSVSAGIISARARDIQAGPYDDFLQTDAAINPGNSGGPLFNLRGEVIGINTAIIGGGTGIGFAVPSNMAQSLLPQLESGVVRRGWLGVAIQDLTPELARAMALSVETGAVVADVNPDTPAAKAGLKADDVVVEVDGEPIDSAKALTRAIGFKPPTSTVRLLVWRGGQRRTLEVVLGERPDLEGVAGSPRGEPPPASAERLGLTVQERRAPEGGSWVQVVSVTPGSPADEAGLRPGMRIVEVAGKPLDRASQLYSAIREANEGEVLLLRVEYNGQRLLRALRLS